MELLYEMWLHAISKFEPEVSEKIAPLFENEGRSFSSREMDVGFIKDIGLSGEFAKRISQPEFFKEAKDIIEYCEASGIRIITRDSDEYPQELNSIAVPPRLLFAKGARLNLKNRVSVSVVGCRKSTEHGKSFARLLGKTLAENNIAVISGMAEGIDGQAHQGALDAGGYTVAVLAGSVDEVYPKCHERLYREILENGGTIISERPPRTVTKKYFYQQRNRIITGLTRGTVFVEGKEGSGTSITVRHTLENNKDVFAVPGSPMLWQSELPNRLIAEGAIVVNKPEVPVEYYKEQFGELIFKNKPDKTESEKEKSGIKLVSDDGAILEFLRNNGGIANIEEIAQGLGIGVSVLSGRLTILCIKGRLRQESGNRYVLTD